MTDAMVMPTQMDIRQDARLATTRYEKITGCLFCKVRLALVVNIYLIVCIYFSKAGGDMGNFSHM